MKTFCLTDDQVKKLREVMADGDCGPDGQRFASPMLSEVEALFRAEYVHSGELPRDSIGAPCRCGGYADRQDERPTEDEIERYDCGRKRACCTAVFRCRLCDLRFIGQLDAPEMD